LGEVEYARIYPISEYDHFSLTKEIIHLQVVNSPVLRSNQESKKVILRYPILLLVHIMYIITVFVVVVIIIIILVYLTFTILNNQAD